MDIGANIGIYSFLMATQKKARKVFAFEPEPRSRYCLESTVKTNGLNNLHVSPLGVSSQEQSQASFFVSAKNHGGHSLDPNSILSESDAVAGKISIGLTTLDTFLRENNELQPDLIKVDAQQHENQILLGAAKTLSEARPIIDLECFRQDMTTLLPHFYNKNYRAYKAKSNLEFAVENEEWKAGFPEGSEHANVLFFPIEKREQVFAAVKRSRHQKFEDH